MHDVKQTLPVVQGGDHIDIVQAALFSSPHWPLFQRHILLENMRLARLTDPIEQAQQTAYDEMIRAVGENRHVDNLLIFQEPPEGQDVPVSMKEFILCGIPKENIFDLTPERTQIEPVDSPPPSSFSPTFGPPEVLRPNQAAMKNAVDWLYPGGLSAAVAAMNVILATTNAIVDEWNEYIALLNPNPEIVLLSNDCFTDVDDKHGHLSNMISDEVLKKYNSNDVPAHKLKLKVGDVCIIMRNLSVADGITNNTRVQILQISTNRIRCQTLGDNPISIVLPRIRFNFRLPYGKSFMMTRMQFPLRRAYCLSVHKSQGQTLNRVLIDARAGFFAHGQLYVGLSRVTHYMNMALCVTFEQLYHEYYGCGSTVTTSNHEKARLINVVYPEAIQELTAHFHPTPTPIGRAAAPAATHPVGPVAVGPSGSGPTSAVVGSVAVGATAAVFRSTDASITTPIDGDAVTDMYPFLGARARDNDPDY